MLVQIRNRLNKIIAFLGRDENFPLVLFFLALFSFGLLIPWLGLYSDDWHYFWLSYRLDFIARFFIRNRPFLGTVYDVINNFIGASPLQWQIVLFFLKWTAVVSLWYTLKRLFTEGKEKAKWICLLFAFYPGNLILFQPLVFIVAALQLNLFFLSYYFNIRAIQEPGRKWLFLAIALATSLMNLVASEYFFFLELLRPVVIWMVLGSVESVRKVRIRKTFLAWLPYLTIFTAVVVWRFLFQNSLSSHQVLVFQDFLKQPIETLISFFSAVIRSYGQLFITAWNNRLLLDQIYEPQQLVITFYFLFLLVISALIIFKTFFKNNFVSKNDSGKQNWGLGLVGLAAIFLGGLPIWLSKYSLDFTFRTENRFILPFILGVSLSLAGFTFAVFKDKLTRVFCLTAAVAAGVGFQFLTANLYRQETENLKQYFWQMQWRAPSMQTGIHLVSNPPPFTMEGENSLSAGINWNYGRNEAAKQIDYYLYFNPQRIQKEIGALVKDKPLQIGHQIGDFSGNQLRLLAFLYTPPGCLQIVNPALSETAKDAPDYVIESALSSDIGLIQPEESDLNIARLHQIFGDEPEHGWCYFFEKADLARQFEDWQQINIVYKLVVDSQLKPSNPLEWSPFIEGLARTQHWQQAIFLSREITATTASLNQPICTIWLRILKASKPTDTASEQSIRSFLDKVNCPFN
jgi:hypothetical protein